MKLYAFAIFAAIWCNHAAWAQQPGVVSEEFIFEQAPFKSCHASTIIEAPGKGGGLIAAWFGGSREADPDVGIWLSHYRSGKWSAPMEVANGARPGAARQSTFNPVLFQPPGGPLMLFYKVGRKPKGWRGYVKTLNDGGTHWSEAEQLPDPLIGPVKNKPVMLNDGSILSGSSTEHDGWRVHFERSTDNGKTWTMVGPVNDGKEIAAIQPCILLLGGDKLKALARTRQGKIGELTSNDAGKTWGPMSLTALPNPNSGIDAVTLKDGRHLLVYNHTAKGRSPINLALSKDGASWEAVAVLASDPGKEFSYPTIIQTSDGLVHITYTWQRQRIKHFVIEPAKLQPRPIKEGAWPSP